MLFSMLFCCTQNLFLNRLYVFVFVFLSLRWEDPGMIYILHFFTLFFHVTSRKYPDRVMLYGQTLEILGFSA